MLEKLLSQIEETVKELSKFNSSIVPEDGGPPITLSRLLPSLEDAEFQIRSMLMFLARRSARSADALSYCLFFLSELCGGELLEISENDLKLVRVIMKAHGFSDNDLIDGKLVKASWKNRTIQKRIDTFFGEYTNVINSQLELDEKRSNKPSFDPTLWQRQNLPELLRVVELVQERELAEFLQKRVARQQQMAELLKKLEAVINLREQAGQIGEHEIGEGRVVESG